MFLKISEDLYTNEPLLSNPIRDTTGLEILCSSFYKLGKLYEFDEQSPFIVKLFSGW